MLTTGSPFWAANAKNDNQRQIGGIALLLGLLCIAWTRVLVRREMALLGFLVKLAMQKDYVPGVFGCNDGSLLPRRLPSFSLGPWLWVRNVTPK